MFQGIWCRLSMVFLPIRETGPISVVRCVHYPVHAHVGVLLLFSVALFEAGSHWTGNLLFLLHWLASEPHLSPFHSTEIQMYTCWVSAASTLNTESIPQSLCLTPDALYLHHTPRGFYSTLFLVPNNVFLYSKTFISACRPLRVPKTLNLQRSKLLL